MPANRHTIATTRRFLRAKPTSQSIIEQDSALYDHAVAGFDAALDDGLIALLETDFDGACLERPRLDLDEYLIDVVLQHERRGRDDRHHLLGSEEGDVGEHSGLQSYAQVGKRDPDLGATGVRIEHVADEKDAAFHHLGRIGGK